MSREDQNKGTLGMPYPMLEILLVDRYHLFGHGYIHNQGISWVVYWVYRLVFDMKMIGRLVLLPVLVSVVNLCCLKGFCVFDYFFKGFKMTGRF